MSRKHRVYKYSGFWYACCGMYPNILTARRWASALWSLEFHVREHRPGLNP